jgi:hypothetical protein
MLHNISTVTGRTMYRGVYPQRFSCKGGHEKHRRKPKEGSLPILRSGYQSCYTHGSLIFRAVCENQDNVS